MSIKAEIVMHSFNVSIYIDIMNQHTQHYIANWICWTPNVELHQSILSHLLNFETESTLHSVLRIGTCGSHTSQMERMSKRVNSSVCHQGVSLFINRLEGITGRKWQEVL